MQNSRDIRIKDDITTDDAWVLENFNRLLGFEVLTKEISGNPNPIPQELLADKIAVSSKFESRMMKNMRRRLLS